MIANYHTHTYRCHHAIGSDREYVEAAIAAGFQEIGFADHAPFVYPSGFVSSIRMLPGEVDGYVTSLLELRKEYQKEISIRIGFESEYCPELLPLQQELLADYPIDYMIMGQHFLAPDDGAPYMGSPMRETDLLKRYVDSIIEGMDTGKYKYLAHPDLVNYQGNLTDYKQHMTRLCQEMKKREIPLEFNLLGFAEARHYPNETFWQIVGETGNDVIFGSDAHRPDQIWNPAVYEEAMKIIRKYQLHLISMLNF